MSQNFIDFCYNINGDQMKVNIQIDGLQITVNLFKVEFWNQRFFCIGEDCESGHLYRFVSTKGFDRLLVERDKGARFTFRKEHFSPYLCNKDMNPLYLRNRYNLL